MAGACGEGPTSPSQPASLSVGRWAGTTAQGAAITFEVSSTEILTSISVGHNFNGCSGTQTFSNLNVSTLPNVICIPGPCPSTPNRQFNFSDGTHGAGAVTTVNGLFVPGGRAQGFAGFQDYPGCGTVRGVAWTATRR